MTEVFYFHVQEDRSIKYKLPEPIMQEDNKTNGDIVISNPNSGVTLSGFFRTVIPILIQ